MLKRWYRTRNDRILAGVLGGLGNVFGVHPAIFRVLFIFCAVSYLPLGVALLLAYAIAWIVLPEAEPGWERSFAPLLGDVRRSNEERMLTGVCGGLAEYYRINVTVLRAAWAILTLLTAGAGAFAYLLAWVLIPQEPL
ncbi:phage shock protein PspC (stress-responsive transcriptional regulator) [Deinobacterium chartae]|uniref:Phage shock protein PspC (Stress-responsive transcriptional regulator) n=1 Tax=Deinobacterium chartae TaxID=521158 RepID=A0A841HYL0_9DEIO|nr:PspC domain-containing protein [Deinobacterium chartae]MBB6097028.1 phage shock protein PspC (stress-responsive transcriptional regulator) [Deinobacterium chartae]